MGETPGVTRVGEPAEDARPFLSIVVTARNDGHGGGFLRRMQIFVTGVLEQAARHALHSELIIVEWNPPSDRPRLADVLQWPPRGGPCNVRIIEVPSALHRWFAHSDKLGLFQMIAKNVGIRRARGQFVLCTNIDLLFSEEIMRFFTARSFRPRSLYRVDRLDVPSEVPAPASIDEQLDYCRRNVFRVNTRTGAMRPEELGWYPALLRYAKAAGGAVWAVLATPPRMVWRAIRKVSIILWRNVVRLRRAMARIERGNMERLERALVRIARRNIARLKRLVLRGVRAIPSLVSRSPRENWRAAQSFRREAWQRLTSGAQYYGRMVAKTGPADDIRELLDGVARVAGEQRAMLQGLLRRFEHYRVMVLHTVTCGDFTLLSHEDWFRLRGYPEWQIYSLHIDSVLCYMARYSGIREIVLRRKMAVYHIDHHSGWSPEGADTLTKRMNAMGVPILNYEQLCTHVLAMHRRKSPLISNDEHWGLGSEVLVETDPTARLTRPVDTPAADVRHDRLTALGLRES
jgi:hypothetical protein